MPISSGTYSEASITKSWGVSPGSATVTIPGEYTSLSAGDETTLNIGGSTFQGMVTSTRVAAQGLSGKSTILDIADNRIHFQLDSVKCAFNFTQVRADNPATPGIDRQVRYWSIFPVDHTAQLRQWTNSPFTALDCLQACINADNVFPWSISDPGGLLDKPVYEIDANDGAKMGTIVAQICDQLGILCTVTGYATLRFARKGVGTEPYLDAATVGSFSDGEALSNVDAHVEVVGGRNVYQDFEIVLEPWWNRGWETYWLEADWLDRVQALWGSEWAGAPNNDVKNALRAAKSRQVTLRDYVVKVESETLADFALWGEVSRMEVPVWLYLRDIVFKAYRVPRSYVLNLAGVGGGTEVPIDQLAMRDGLLGAVDYDEIGNMYLKVFPARQWYPDYGAFVLVQGQPLNLIDPRGHKFASEEQLARMREVWGVNSGFVLDMRPESCGFIFEDVLFVDSAENPLVTFPNHGKDGITSSHPLYNIGVPNVGVDINPAVVKASIAWEADKYLKSYGSGPRWGTAQAQGIQKHNIVQEGVVTEEVPYADGHYADDKAEQFASGRVAQQQTYDLGTRVRSGGSGTPLSGVVDRVSVKVDFSGGTVETVELTKERQPVTYFNERLLDRLAQMHDRYKSERANRTEIWELQSIAQVNRARGGFFTQMFKNLQQFLDHPLGVTAPGTKLVKLADAKPPGCPVWREDYTDDVSDSGEVFVGVTIADNMGAGTYPVATQGEVPVRVKGPFSAGDAVGADSSEDFCKPGGARAVGAVTRSYSGTDTVLAPVRLGSSVSAAPSHRLKITNTSTAAGGGDPAVARFRIQYGEIAGVKADPTMADMGDTPIFQKIVTSGEGWNSVYTKHAMTYIGNGQWAAGYGTVYVSDADVVKPENDADWYYLEIGQVHVNADGVIDNIMQGPKGDMEIAREGSETIYRERHWQVLAP